MRICGSTRGVPEKERIGTWPCTQEISPAHPVGRGVNPDPTPSPTTAIDRRRATRHSTCVQLTPRLSGQPPTSMWGHLVGTVKYVQIQKHTEHKLVSSVPTQMLVFSPSFLRSQNNATTARCSSWQGEPSSLAELAFDTERAPLLLTCAARVWYDLDLTQKYKMLPFQVIQTFFLLIVLVRLWPRT